MGATQPILTRFQQSRALKIIAFQWNNWRRYRTRNNCPTELQSSSTWERLENCSSSEHQNTRTPEHRNTGTPEHRNTGTPEHRNTGTPEHRNTGTPEHRNTGTPEHRNTGTPEHQNNQNTRTPEHQNTRTPEQPEHQNTRTPEHCWSACFFEISFRPSRRPTFTASLDALQDDSEGHEWLKFYFKHGALHLWISVAARTLSVLWVVLD